MVNLCFPKAWRAKFYEDWSIKLKLKKSRHIGSLKFEKIKKVRPHSLPLWKIGLINRLEGPILKNYLKKTLDWSKIHLLPRLATINNTLHSFQYKLLNNALFINKKTKHFRNNKRNLFLNL